MYTSPSSPYGNFLSKYNYQMRKLTLNAHCLKQKNQRCKSAYLSNVAINKINRFIGKMIRVSVHLGTYGICLIYNISIFIL